MATEIHDAAADPIELTVMPPCTRIIHMEEIPKMPTVVHLTQMRQLVINHVVL